MSRFAIIPRRAIEDDRFSMSHLRIMAAIGSFTDKAGWCFPSMTTLGRMVGVSRQRVSICIGDLSDWGYLEVHIRNRESDGGQTSHGYRVLFDVGTPDVETPAILDCTPPQRLEVAAPATPGGCTKKVPINAPPISLEAQTTIAGRACILMREAGLIATNPSHPKLLEAIQAGVTPEELADVAREIPGKPMAYVVAAAHRRKIEGSSNGQGSENGGAATGRTFTGQERGRGESHAAWVERINRQHDQREAASR